MAVCYRLGGLAYNTLLLEDANMGDPFDVGIT